jgi:hypothetical protein
MHTNALRRAVVFAVVVLGVVSGIEAQSVLSMSRSPIAIRVGSTQPVTLQFTTSGTITGLRLDLQSGGAVTMTQTSAGRWEGSITAAQALFGYDAADVNHNFIGYLRVLGAGGAVTSSYNVFINVVDDNVPSVTVQTLYNDGRRTARVLNLRRPELTLSPETAPATRTEDIRRAVREAYKNLPDGFDFVQVAWTLPTYFQNRGHLSTKNNVSGIGSTIKDDDALWGSAGKLQGVTVFPLDTYVDFAEATFSHETAHQWVMFSKHPLLQSAIPHWPPSTMGRGIMGVTISGSVGGAFPWTITQVSATTVRTDQGKSTETFDDFDLYLMGLLPAESVAPGWVLQGTACAGCTVAATRFTINDLINVEGPRNPNAAQSQKSFRLATVIITSDRLLNDDEMAMFEYWVRRGEGTTEVPYTSGLAGGTAKPWAVATRGLSTVDFRLGDTVGRRRVARK